ncbi:insulinase family protein [Siculibacillus lacustris]|uniref:Insulinase family protein n=1 Tax=Siculibacillus lacustris TaxID=1549641 RepID=A0A4V2KSI1_9HYPH|nr:pitrilysin family protein [Siculibacillus lacustris]TBW32886.1 insulinase family protein [Siculibacillus lacustris]
MARAFDLVPIPSPADRVRRTLRGVVCALGLVLAAGLASPASATTVQRVVSPKGIEAWLVEEHAVPMIAVDFSFEGGSTQDPAGKEGITDLLSSLLDEGAGDLPSQEFQTRLEDLSVEFGFHDRADRFDGEMKTLSKNRDAAFDLLALALNRPRFDAEAVERMRVQAITGLRRAEKNPDQIAGRRLLEAVFPGHPYGRPSEGTEASLTAITPADLHELHRRLFVRAGLKIAVVGDIDAATLAPQLDRLFAGLPAEGRRVAVAEVVPKAGGRITVAAPIPQAVVRLGAPGLKRDDPDFMAAYVMNHILGGGSFSSWLYREVREKRGLAYSISTGLAPYVHAGLFLGAVGTRAEAVDETLALMRTEIARMRDTGPDAAELTAAKAYLIGSYPLRFDTSDKIAGSLLAIMIDDLGIDWIDRRNAAIEAVTLADVRRVAARLFAVEPTVVVVGPTRD